MVAHSPEPGAHVVTFEHSGSNWNLEALVFEERGKPEYPEKNLSKQRREPTTNSIHIWHRVRESIPGHIGGRRVLSPLRHPCSLEMYQKTKQLFFDAGLYQGHEKKLFLYAMSDRHWYHTWKKFSPHVSNIIVGDENVLFDLNLLPRFRSNVFEIYFQGDISYFEGLRWA